jgi:hypothetical protein
MHTWFHVQLDQKILDELYLIRVLSKGYGIIEESFKNSSLNSNRLCLLFNFFFPFIEGHNGTNGDTHRRITDEKLPPIHPSPHSTLRANLNKNLIKTTTYYLPQHETESHIGPKS